MAINKIISALVAIGILTGCSTTPRQIDLTTKTVPQSVPILYCPAPLQIARPDLPIETMLSADAAIDGKVVENYAATITTLEGYVIQLETELTQYQKDHDQYAALAETLDQQWFAKTGTHLELPSPPAVISPVTTK